MTSSILKFINTQHTIDRQHHNFPNHNPTSICMQDAWRFNSEFFFYTVHSQLWVFIPFRRKTLFLSLTPETHLKLFSCQQVAKVLCDSNSKVQQSFNDNAMALSRLSIIKLLELVSHVSRVKKNIIELDVSPTIAFSNR